MVNKDDFIVHLRSFEGGLEKASSQGIISPAYHTFHGEDVDSRFYYAYFRSKNFINKDLKPHVYGIRDGRSIDIEGMKTIRIPWASYPEQKSIGDFLTHLDILITLHQRKLEKLVQIRKAFAERCFLQSRKEFVMAFTKEADFEEAVVKLLIDRGWKDGVLKNYTEQQLIQNWANILFENNRGIDRLNDYPLTDGEMQQIMEQVMNAKTPMKLNKFQRQKCAYQA